METARNFLPSLSTLLKIIEACGSTPEEFFYSDIHQYKTDKKALDFLKTLSETQKEAIMNLYKNSILIKERDAPPRRGASLSFIF